MFDLYISSIKSNIAFRWCEANLHVRKMREWWLWETERETTVQDEVLIFSGGRFSSIVGGNKIVIFDKQWNISGQFWVSPNIVVSCLQSDIKFWHIHGLQTKPSFWRLGWRVWMHVCDFSLCGAHTNCASLINCSRPTDSPKTVESTTFSSLVLELFLSDIRLFWVCLVFSPWLSFLLISHALHSA